MKIPSETRCIIFCIVILLFFLPFPWLSMALFIIAVISAFFSDKKALSILKKIKIWFPLTIIIAFHLFFKFRQSNNSPDNLLILLLNPFYFGIIARVFGLFIMIKLFLKALPVKNLLVKLKGGKRSNIARMIIVSLNLLNVMKLSLSQAYYYFRLKGGLKHNGLHNLYFLLLSIFFNTIHFSEEISFNFARKFGDKD